MKKKTVLIVECEPAQAFLEYALILALLVLIGVLGIHILGTISGSHLEKLDSAFNETASNPADNGANDGNSELEPTLPPDETIFVLDEFDNLDDWKKINGPNCWKTGGGVLSVSKGSCTSVLMNQAVLPDDYQISMQKAKLLNGLGYGLMFRLSKDENSFTGYSFQVDRGLGNQFVFRRYDKNGTELGQPLAAVPAPVGFDFTTAHSVEVSVVGDTFTAYVDGVQVLSAVDDTYPSGGSGLRTWGDSQSEFDGFSVLTP